MNRKLVILTGLIVFAFGMQTAFLFFEPITTSVDKKREQQIEDPSAIKSYINLEVDLVSDKTSSDTLMVYNNKTDTWMPAKVEKVSVEIKEKQLSLYYMIPVVLLLLITTIIIIVQFYKLITAVGKSKIFEWVNVKRLRYIGCSLVVLFLIDFVGNIILLQMTRGYVSFSNYHLDGEWNAINLILGLFSLLIAEIFAKGLHLKEEQELTI